MMPSSVGSLDMTMSNSTAPVSSSWPLSRRWCIAFRTSRARATNSSGPSSDAVAAGADVDTQPVFSARDWRRTARIARRRGLPARRIRFRSWARRGEVLGRIGARSSARAGLRAMRSFQVGRNNLRRKIIARCCSTRTPASRRGGKLAERGRQSCRGQRNGRSWSSGVRSNTIREAISSIAASNSGFNRTDQHPGADPAATGQDRQ